MNTLPTIVRTNPERSFLINDKAMGRYDQTDRGGIRLIDERQMMPPPVLWNLEKIHLINGREPERSIINREANAEEIHSSKDREENRTMSKDTTFH